MKKKHSPYIEKQMENLGKRLKFLRKQQESNYEQFVFKHDIGRAQYGRYETGSDMNITTLLRILEALEVSPREFFSEGV